MCGAAYNVLPSRHRLLGNVWLTVIRPRGRGRFLVHEGNRFGVGQSAKPGISIERGRVYFLEKPVGWSFFTYNHVQFNLIYGNEKKYSSPSYSVTFGFCTKGEVA